MNISTAVQIHHLLWKDVPPGREGVIEVLARISRLLSSELLTIAAGDDRQAAKLLNEGIVTVVEKELALMAADPTVKGIVELIRATTR